MQQKFIRIIKTFITKYKNSITITLLAVPIIISWYDTPIYGILPFQIQYFNKLANNQQPYCHFYFFGFVNACSQLKSDSLPVSIKKESKLNIDANLILTKCKITCMRMNNKYCRACVYALQNEQKPFKIARTDFRTIHKTD